MHIPHPSTQASSYPREKKGDRTWAAKKKRLWGGEGRKKGGGREAPVNAYSRKEKKEGNYRKGKRSRHNSSESFNGKEGKKKGGDGAGFVCGVIAKRSAKRENKS